MLRFLHLVIETAPLKKPFSLEEVFSQLVVRLPRVSAAAGDVTTDRNCAPAFMSSAILWTMSETWGNPQQLAPLVLALGDVPMAMVTANAKQAEGSFDAARRLIQLPTYWRAAPGLHLPPP